MIIYLILSIVLGALGHIAAKLSTLDLRRIYDLISIPYFYLALACYGVSFVFWTVFLKGKDLSTVVPLNSLTYILVVVLSFLFFGERLKLAQYAGIAMIVLGVFLLER